MKLMHVTTRGLSKRAGSSLLVALLIMGVLMTLTLGLSSLVIREIRQTADLVAAGKAYYAAEAGIEHALFELSTNLPGYETGEEGSQPDYVRITDEDLDYQYKISNKGDTIPYFPDDEPIFLTEGGAVSRDTLFEDFPDKTYNVLPLNGSVTIPLFVDDGGESVDVTDFLIQYYVDFKIDPNFLSGKLYDWDPDARKEALSKFDVLRWKVFGNPTTDAGSGTLGWTEAISDFFPASGGANAYAPVCIGSDITMASDFSCQLPVDISFNESDSATNQGVPGWSYARECYLKDSGAGVIGSATGTSGIRKECTIKSFIDAHQRNYVTLTNIINPDIVGITNPELRDARANIYWRIVAKSGSGEAKLVRQFADIKADGFASGASVKQSIDAKVGMSSSLPVFNFSLYRTDTEDDTFSPAGDAGDDLDLFGGLGF